MKHLIKNNQIITSGLPSHFTRENGEGFWGGYEERTDLHYEDGWRDEVIPEIDAKLQYLGAAYYDPEQDVVTYEVLTRTIDLEREKSRLLTELAEAKREVALLVMEATLTYEVIPENLQAVINTARSLNTSVKEAINNLTEENVLNFKIRTPEFYGLVNTIKNYL